MYMENRAHKIARKVTGYTMLATLIAAPFTGGASLYGTLILAAVGHHMQEETMRPKYFLKDFFREQKQYQQEEKQMIAEAKERQQREKESVERLKRSQSNINIQSIDNLVDNRR